MKIASCSVTCSWLTKSASVGGRSERSRSSSGTSARASCTRTSASTRRRGSSSIARACGSGSAPMSGASLMPRFRERRPCAARPAISSSGSLALDPVEQLLGLQRRVAEVDQAVAGEARGRRRRRGQRRDLLLERAGDLLAQLDDDPLRGPLADPGHRLEALGVAGGDRPQQLARRAAGERRDRDLGPDAADRDQLAEEVALLLGGEAVEGERVVAGDQLGVQEGLAPGRRAPPSASPRRPRAGSRRRRRR